MKIFKEIFGRIWAVWGLVWFLFTLLIFVWPITFTFLIKEPKGVKIFKAFSKCWMTIFLYGIGCPIRIIGKKNYDAGKQYVVTANHQSFMDVPLLTPFFPGPNKTIAKKSMSRIPLFGWVYTRGSVLVDRGNDASRKKSFDAMKHVLQVERLNMAVYPEGTRNRTGAPLKSFYDGAFKLALDCKLEVMPVVMLNTATVMPPGKIFYLWPATLQLHILPAINSANKTLAEVKAQVHQQMWNYIESNK